MREDYLWDKSGEDAEIERLENVLQAFRFKENAAPAIPFKVSEFVKESKESSEKRFSRRRVLPLALAAACAAIAFGVWFQITKNVIKTAEIAAETNKSQNETVAPQITGVEKPAEKSSGSAVKTIEKTKRTENVKEVFDAKVSKIRRVVSPNISPNNRPRTMKLEAAQPQSVKTAESIARLTDEERYAYRQLMLALSITSSKLKLVKDKAESVEGKNVGAGGGR